MAEWITPIYDRTETDVTAAKIKIAEWIEAITSGAEATTEDLKGCINASDLNRIENNTKFLSETLTALGYSSTVTTKTWARNSFPNVDDVQRIIANVQTVITSYYKYTAAPALPATMLDYEQVNDVERNLFYLKDLLDWMVGAFRKSGTFASGQARILPLRR